MLDIKFIKENKDIVENACKNKNKVIDLESLISAYDTRTTLKREIDEINCSGTKELAFCGG